jgi:hypothetical protein
MQLNVYFLRNEGVALAHRTVPATTATSRAALEQLLAGPSTAERGIGMGTAIPADTRLVDIDVAGGIATVELSTEFGLGGGTLSMTARLAQVVYTLTQFPTVSAVVFAENGVPITMFGTEGIMIDGPLGRADYESVTPMIFVDGPAPFDMVGDTIRVYGTANVFEAQFVVRLTDVAGTVLYEGPQMATSGTGTRGTFDFTIRPTVTTPGRGVLRLWEPSAMDGSDTNVVEIPVEL